MNRSELSASTRNDIFFQGDDDDDDDDTTVYKPP